MGPERFEVAPERLGRWLERWRGEHGEIVATDRGPSKLTFTAADGARLVCEPPFPPLDGDLLEHVARERTVGVLLVRLGGYGAGVFRGRELVESKVGSRLVHGRHKAGGSSQQRFARRRQGQARVALDEAADVAVRILLPWAQRSQLDAVVTGGDRSAVATVLADRRLEPVAALAVERFIAVPDPRLAVLKRTPERFLATVLTPNAG